MWVVAGRRWSLLGMLFAACADAPVEGSASSTEGSGTTAPTTQPDPTTADPTTSTTVTTSTVTSSSSDSSSATHDTTSDTTTSSTTSDTTTSSTTDTTGTSDSSSDTGVAQICTPGAVQACYEGPVETQDVGPCHAGAQICLPDGTAFGPCTDQVLPALESCDNVVDDDCDGAVNQADAGCVCLPGAEENCYEGPDGTLGQGVCVAGTRICADDGLGFGPCEGQVQPASETCDTPVDDDCDGQVNEGGLNCACVPDSIAPCYGGPIETEDVGPCHGGTQTCNEQGTAYGPCVGEVVPTLETCDTPVDDDCDGQVNEDGAGCVCIPNSVSACYTGPPGTQNVGVCKAGTRTCNPQGTAYGPCTGEVTPVPEDCLTAVDDNCDGAVNEGCPLIGYAGNVQPIFLAKCAPCHTAQTNGGLNVNDYATTQLNSGVCAGKTKGACALVRIQNGTMPLGKGCTGNPVLDAGNAACLTGAQQNTIQAWIAGGQLP